jgi:hypothetical protein
MPSGATGETGGALKGFARFYGRQAQFKLSGHRLVKWQGRAFIN